MNDSHLDAVLLFTSIAEFEARPNFHAELQLTADELDRIIGKYELPANRGSWALCGLNNCHREHRFGYVIRAKDGRETNIGHECGKREFDVEFEEVEARYKRAVDAQARQRAVTALLAERALLVARCEEIQPTMAKQSARYSAFRATFQPVNGFWLNLLKCAKLGGAIRAARQNSAWNPSKGGKEEIVTVGRFAGGAALLEDGSGLGNVITNDVLPWLRALDADRLTALDDAGMTTTLREAAARRGTLERAEAFAAHSSALLTPQNVAAMRAICDHLMKSSDAGHAEALLEKWVAEAQTAGVPEKPVRIHKDR
ncbi:hypothetical protein [Variovorax soli]|uniref:hypothetical protein n=1 Tax=Variovorax soli TaxID=376815 RepID=UPI00083980CE|nr:hypothetical protein [Variovorax soli]